MKNVKRTERGWPGHFCASSKCLFRRNTLLEVEGDCLVVSTVGNYRSDGGRAEEIGLDRYYETMAFRAELKGDYLEADVTKQINFRTPWSISYPYADSQANEMHENIVEELSLLLARGEGLMEEVRGADV